MFDLKEQDRVGERASEWVMSEWMTYKMNYLLHFKGVRAYRLVLHPSALNCIKQNKLDFTFVEENISARPCKTHCYDTIRLLKCFERFLEVN